PAVEIADVDLAARVLAERADRGDREPARRMELGGAVGEVRDLARSVAEGPDAAAAEVAEEIRALQAAQVRAAVDVAADDRAAGRVRVGADRRRERRVAARAAREPRARVAFHATPAEVRAADACGLEADLLHRVQADVAEVEVVRRAVEAA